MTLVDQLHGRLGEIEAWATAASQTRDPGTPTGEHWRWECTNCDKVIDPDPVVDEHVRCLTCETAEVALRSVEEYPTSSVGPLSAFLIPHAEEVPAVAAGFLALNDPARVLAINEFHAWLLAKFIPVLERVEAQLPEANLVTPIELKLAAAYGITNGDAK